ncbi:hypothetical protein [Nioella sp.]|uniref:hypothetical protein n=1 Tax=Nioella sp. TaxID=1912091 RepID=UPI0035195AB4
MSGGNLTGHVEALVGGSVFTLFFGFRGMEEMKARHGKGWIHALEQAHRTGDVEAIDFTLLLDLIELSLRRHHAADLAADPYLPDDILLQDSAALPRILEATFGAEESDPGNRPAATSSKRARKATTSPRG